MITVRSKEDAAFLASKIRVDENTELLRGLPRLLSEKDKEIASWIKALNEEQARHRTTNMHRFDLQKENLNLSQRLKKSRAYNIVFLCLLLIAASSGVLLSMFLGQSAVRELLR